MDQPKLFRKTYIMPKELHQQIRELAVKEGLTNRELIKRAIASYLMKKGEEQCGE